MPYTDVYAEGKLNLCNAPYYMLLCPFYMAHGVYTHLKVGILLRQQHYWEVSAVRSQSYTVI